METIRPDGLWGPNPRERPGVRSDCLDASRINSSISAMGAYSFAAAQRAYGVGTGVQATPARPIQSTPIAKIGDAARAGQIARAPDSVSVGSRASAGGDAVSERLVGAVVPGRIDFTQDQPVQNTSGSLAFYRHPADKNSAATRIAVNTTIDLNA